MSKIFFKQKTLKFMAIILLPFLVIWQAYGNESTLPNISNPYIGVISPKKRELIAQMLLQELYRTNKIICIPLVQQYAEDLVSRISEGAYFSKCHFKVIVIDDPTLNAFAAPGNIIGIHTGLILNARSEGELAAVLSHEIAHNIQQHFARNIEQFKDQELLTIAGVLGGLALILSGQGQLGIAAMSSTIASGIGERLKFSRSQEIEADRIGLNILHKANFNPNAMVSMLGLLKSQEASSQTLEFLQTHPMSINRISDTIVRARQFSEKTYYENSLLFNSIKMYLRVHYDDSPEILLSQLINKKKVNKVFDPVTDYGIALVLYKLHQPTKAMQVVNSLLKKHSDVVAYHVLKAEILLEFKRNLDALDYTAKVNRLFPDHFASKMLRVETIYKLGKFQEAEQLINNLISTQKQANNPFLLSFLTKIYGASNQIENYYMTNAKYLLNKGQAEEAIAQLNYALNNIRMSYQKRQQLLAVLKKTHDESKSLNKLTF